MSNDFKYTKIHNNPQIEDSNKDEEIISQEQKKHKKMIKEDNKLNNINLTLGNQEKEILEQFSKLNKNRSFTSSSIYNQEDRELPNRNQMHKRIQKQNYSPFENSIIESIKLNQNNKEQSFIDYPFE
ncbi:hypothetical protein pb186bvf_000285 [Paramecium bursaria]